jgi:hypothetical protein
MHTNQAEEAIQLDDVKLLGDFDLSNPLGPDLFEADWVAPMNPGDEFPEWTSAELLYEPYTLALMRTPGEAASSTLTSPSGGAAGTVGNGIDVRDLSPYLPTGMSVTKCVS